MKLYELSEQYNKLQELISDGMDPEMLADTLEGLDGDIEDKAESIAKLIKSLEAEADGIKAEETRLYNRRKAIENNVIGIKSYLQQQMAVMGKDKIKTPLFTVSIQNNKPSMKIIDEALIPSDYFLQPPPTLDKEKIMYYLKENQLIPGCELQQSKSIRIR